MLSEHQALVLPLAYIVIKTHKNPYKVNDGMLIEVETDSKRLSKLPGSYTL